MPPSSPSSRGSGLRAWLSSASSPRRADLIFVLAGRVHRKDFALELFRQALAPAILFSVGRYEIRRFSKMALPVPLDLLRLSKGIPPSQRHFFAFFQGKQAVAKHVPPGRFGTLTEIKALARWLTDHPEIRSVLVVSSASHLRRIRMCCRFLLDPQVQMAFLASSSSIAGAVASASNAGIPVPAEPDHASVGAHLVEFFKLIVYWFLLRFR